MNQQTPRTPSNILAGPARIYTGVYGTAVAPVSGTPPTLFQHTSGVPSGLQANYNEVGYSTGPVTFSYKAEKSEISPEQSFSAVDTFMKAESSSITFTAMEGVYRTLLAAFDNVGNQNDSTGSLFYAGNGAGIVTTLFYTVFFSAQHRDNVAKYSWGCIYKAYSVDGIKLPFEKSKETTYAVTLKSVADVTRNTGDQIFQLKFEQ